ncbi:hypothetical protein, partial [Limosilactobacillus reuteri]|uniref:hypothetical protein n=1 Tax=Limosilactobacillus reuteri TaxID=1598 RepID=UPI00399651EF
KFFCKLLSCLGFGCFSTTFHLKNSLNQTSVIISFGTILEDKASGIRYGRYLKLRQRFSYDDLMIDCNQYEAYLLIVAERKNGNSFAEMTSHFAQIVAVSEASNWLEKSIRPSFLIKLFAKKFV